MKNTIKAILFDLDNTLWAIDPVIERAEDILQQWLAIHAPAVAKSNSISTFRNRRKQLIRENPRYGYELWALRHATLAEAFAKAGEDLRKVDDAMHTFSHARNAVYLYDDVVPALHNLGSRYAIGSVSNGAADLEQIGIARHFQVSITASRLGVAKPEAAIFHAACNALNIPPSETVYVGDDPQIDIIGAMNAGLKTAWIKRADLDHTKILPEDIRPDIIIYSLSDLETLFMQ